MSHNHDHNHDHEVITLVDEQGNETLFEILLTIDGREEFGKNYVLLVPAGAEEDANGEIEIQAYSFTENEDGTEGDLQPIPEDSDAEWDMIEEVFNTFMAEEEQRNKRNPVKKDSAFIIQNLFILYYLHHKDEEADSKKCQQDKVNECE